MEKLSKLYEEIGIYCPFALASRLNIMHSRLDMGKEHYGLYVVSGQSTHRIVINSEIEQEVQEYVCELPVAARELFNHEKFGDYTEAGERIQTVRRHFLS